MNMNQLIIFHEVARLENFTRASEQLCLTQPGISKHIKQLEDYYGTRLFDRLGKKVVVTQAGAVLFKATEEIIGILKATRERIDDIKGVKGGKLKVGASFTLGIHIIPELLNRFRQKYPDVELSLDISMSHKICKKLISNDLDIGFLGAPADDERVLTKELLSDQLVLIVASHHKWKNRKKIQVTELLNEPFLMSRQGSGTRITIETQLKQNNIQFRKIIEFGNTEAVKKAVITGIGVSILSIHAVENEARSGLLKTLILADLQLKRTFYLAYHANKYLSYATRALIDLVQQ